MLDRTDIDALLIGALYGELTPADEARLTQHLESHPGDKVTLEDLTRARIVVRDSRILAFQFDPPQAVSAILLQEAARRAPARPPVHASDEHREGWFQRFVRSFMAHPAMAAAAMLVIVAGVAGTMYSRNGSKGFAEEHVGQKQSAVVAAGEQQRGYGSSAVADISQQTGEGDALKAPAPAVMTDKGGDRNGYTAKLDDSVAANAKHLESPAADPAPPAKPDLAIASAHKPAQSNGPSGITVLRTEPQPKDFDSNDGVPDADAKKADTVKLAQQEQQDQQGQGNRDSSGATNSAPAHSRVADAPTAPNTTPRAASHSDSPDKAKEASDASLLAWADQQHAQLSRLAKDGNCTEAARVAVLIQNRAPDYYASKVATDRSVKQCMSYINDAREKDAEQANKARAKRNAPNENDLPPQPSPAPTSSNK